MRSRRACSCDRRERSCSSADVACSLICSIADCSDKFVVSRGKRDLLMGKRDLSLPVATSSWSDPYPIEPQATSADFPCPAAALHAPIGDFFFKKSSENVCPVDCLCTSVNSGLM